MTNNARPKTDRRRARPTPGWLLERKDLDDIARRRCLMVLSVLSGERAVTDVIEEAQIARGTYYQLEERALKAMLGALMPGGEQAASESPAARIAQLEAKVATLEREKRRGERLLLLTRKVVKAGSMKSRAGRPRKTSSERSSTKRGRKSSPGSKTPTSANTSSANPSMLTPDGEGAR
ncbi:MAG TPA: hypothetical protein VK672_02555 [Solirubrobacteraceae bacterium]|jgi:hypothetical protein|nr:hypothetical protein [Solirubrobacteraceae bacterium]